MGMSYYGPQKLSHSKNPDEFVRVLSYAFYFTWDDDLNVTSW